MHQEQAELLDIEAYRALLASAVRLGTGELTASTSGDPKVTIRRRIAAYVLAYRDELPAKDIARILDESESWVRGAIDDIEHRTGFVDLKYRTESRECRALGLLLERMITDYAYAFTDREIETMGSVKIEFVDDCWIRRWPMRMLRTSSGGTTFAFRE